MLNQNKFKTLWSKNKITLIYVTGLILLLAVDAFAGSTNANSSFSSIVSLLEGWATGSLGRTVALGTFVVGGITAIAKQSLMFGTVSTGGAVMMAYGPTILTGMFSATI